MQSKVIAYYADFWVYPFVLLILVVCGALATPAVHPLAWIVSALLGLVLWTLAEYLIHRIVLHNIGYFHELHEQHHAAPVELIGTPLWLSLSILMVVVILPCFYVLGTGLGSGFAFGTTFGYLAYSFTHHVLHHWNIRPGSYLYEVKRRHALHHHRDADGNFGVTNLFWDRIFGTVLPQSFKRKAS